MSFESLTSDRTFRFFCHPDIPCFNACCRDLNHYLTPYDILRLKTALELRSQEFLDTYTECHKGPQTGLPVVSLRMVREDDYACPFVSPGGCTVYKDRPGACRTYPLGRMVARKPGEHTCRESFFLIRESHCLGFQEDREWTVAEWKKNQDLEPFNRMNDLMMEIVSLNNKCQRKLGPEERDLFHMACYDLDRFRDFARQERSWEDIASNQENMSERLLSDDLALIRFGIDWIKSRLFGDPKQNTRIETDAP